MLRSFRQTSESSCSAILPWPNPTRLRNLRLDARGGALDGRHVVVQVVDLAAAPQFPADGLVDDCVIVFQHIGLHRMAVVGRFFNDAHVADAGQRHI